MSTSINSPAKPNWHYALLIAVPALLLWGIFSWSPNFDFTDTSNPKSHPLGGDYLQEYVGGKFIIGTHVAQSLYDLESFKSAQHRPGDVGFQWDQSQYFPPVYPPFWYAAVSPLSRIDYAVACHVWAALMTLCLIAALILIYRCVDVPLPVLLLFCASTPVIHNISSGQKGTLLLLIFTGSFVLLKKQRPLSSGGVFALSLFKPYLGVCIGLWMLISGRWGWVVATLSTVAMIVLGSICFHRELSEDYLRVCLGFGDYVQSGGYDLAKSFSLWSGWQMLISHAATAKVLTLVTALGVLVGALICVRRLSNEDLESFDVAFAVMMLVTTITAPHFYYYDLTILILPAAIFFGQATEKGGRLIHRLPFLLIGGAMFFCGAIEQIGLATNLLLGPLILILAIVFAIRNAR